MTGYLIDMQDLHSVLQMHYCIATQTSMKFPHPAPIAKGPTTPEKAPFDDTEKTIGADNSLFASVTTMSRAW